MQISSLLIGLILVGAIVSGLGSAVYTMSESYNVPVSGEYSNTFNRINETTSIAYDISDNLEGQDITEGETSGDLSFLSAAVSSLRMTWQSIGTTKQMIIDTAGSSGLNVANFWPTVLYGILAVAFVFTLIGAYLKHKI